MFFLVENNAKKDIPEAWEFDFAVHSMGDFRSLMDFINDTIGFAWSHRFNPDLVHRVEEKHWPVVTIIVYDKDKATLLKLSAPGK